jgi:hypothetical protein
MMNWNTLAADLAEPSRRRTPQVPAFFDAAQPLSA